MLILVIFSDRHVLNPRTAFLWLSERSMHHGPKALFSTPSDDNKSRINSGKVRKKGFVNLMFNNAATVALMLSKSQQHHRWPAWILKAEIDD